MRWSSPQAKMPSSRPVVQQRPADSSSARQRVSTSCNCGEARVRRLPAEVRHFQSGNSPRKCIVPARVESSKSIEMTQHEIGAKEAASRSREELLHRAEIQTSTADTPHRGDARRYKTVPARACCCARRIGSRRRTCDTRAPRAPCSLHGPSIGSPLRGFRPFIEFQMIFTAITSTS